ncbi:MAG: SdpI family protein [Hellea sp.]
MKPLTFSIVCTLMLTGFALLTWISLPELEHYPVHWNAAGVADGFAGRNAVLGVLMIIPVTLTFMTMLFHFIPSLEPLRQNFEDSRKAYHTIWIALIIFLTIIGIMICLPYKTEDGHSGTLVIRAVGIGTSLLFIGIGNVLATVRQNFMLGIRTPWTLSSELSWEKTHRLGGKLFVLAGVIGIIACALSPVKGLLASVFAVLAASIICAIYSYMIWKDDPHKRR